MNRGQFKRNRNINQPNNSCYKCHTMQSLSDIAKTQNIKGKMRKLDLYNSIYGDKQLCEKHSNTEQNIETNTKPKSNKLFFIIKTNVYDDYKCPESYISVKQQLFEDPNKFMKKFLVEFNDLFNDEMEIESDTNWFKVLEQRDSTLGSSHLQAYYIDISLMKINCINEFDLGYNSEFQKNILLKNVEVEGQDYNYVDVSISPKYMKKLLSSLK